MRTKTAFNRHVFLRRNFRGIGLEGFSCDAVLQRHPVQKLHGDEGLVIVLADFVNGADVRVDAELDPTTELLRPGIAAQQA